MQETSAHYQYFAALVVSLIGIGYGMINGWPSPSIILLESDETPLPSGKLTRDEISWITSVMEFGAFVGSLIFGVIANKFGRKCALICLSISMIIGWLFVCFAQNVYHLYAARILHGAAIVGLCTVTQCYFVEIADDSVRGTLGTSLMVSGHLGVVIAFALGAYSTYLSIPICIIPILVLFIVVMYFFPETPLYLVKQNKLHEAERSIRFYKNIRSKVQSCKIVETEIQKLKHEIETDTNGTSKMKWKWSDVITNPGRKAMIIGVVLGILNHSSGSFVLMSYTALIFHESGSIMSENKSALIVGIIQFIGTLFVPLLIDRVGRKILYITSMIGSVIGFGALGTYMMLKTWNYPVDIYPWIPIVSFSFIVFVQSFGVTSLSFIVTSEIMPEKIKEFGISFSNTMLTVSGFFALKFMPLMSESLGFHGTMFLFGATLIPCVLFIIFYVPETKGKSYDEIMDLLK